MNEEFDINNLIEESLYSDMPDNALDTNNYKSRSLARAKALRRLYYTNLRQSTESSIYTPTYMGEYTGTQSRFDEGLSVIPTMADPNYLNEQRAARQPFLEQLGKGVVHFGADIVGGVIMGAGVLVEPLDSAIKAAVGVENEYGNIIFDIGQTIAEGSKEALPIYSTGPGSSGWAVQGLSSIGSAVGSLFTGMGVMGLLGKVGIVLKMTDTAMDVFNIVSRVAGAAAMRLQENMQEGIGVAEDIIKQGEDLLNKKAYYENFVYPYQNKQYQETLEKLRAVNDPKAMNLPDQLPVPNLLGDYKIKNMDDVYKAAEIGYWTSQKVNAANFVFDFIQLGALSKFNKAIPSFGKIFTPSELLKAQGTQFENKYLRGLNWLLTRPALAESTEAIEEGINFIGEQEGRRAATLMLKGKTDLDDGTDFKERLKGYLGMSEFWDSAFWGFVAGIGGYYVMKGAGFNDHAEDLKQRTAEIAARQKQLNTFIPQVNAIIEGGKYTDPTTGEAEDYSTWDAEKRWEFLTTKTRQMGFDFGMSAARAGNADLLKHKKYIDDVMDRIMQQDAAKDKKSQIQQNEEEVLARKADLKKALMEGLDAGVRSYELAAKTFRYRTKDPVVMGYLINSYANVKLRLEEITKQLNKHDTKIAELSKEYYDHLANLGLNINPTEKDAFLKIVGISTAINYLNKHKQTLQETANKLKNSKSQNTEALNNLIEQIKGVDEMIKSLTDDKNKLSKDMEAFFQSMDKSLKEKNITVKDIINGNFINKGINPDLVDAVINKTILEKTREHLTKRLIDLTNDETIKRTEDAANELRNKQKENLSKAKKRYSFIEKKSKKDEKYINNLEDAVISLVRDDKALENRIEDAKKEKPHLAPFLDDLLYVMKTIGALTHANTIEELDMIRDALLNNPELLNYKDIVDNVYQTTKNRINNGDNTSTQPTAPTTTPEPSPAPTPTASNQSNQGQNTQNELFESNPELANAVYEALGFGQENNTEAKKADIERRRQEELDSKPKVFLHGTKSRIKVFSKDKRGSNQNRNNQIENDDTAQGVFLSDDLETSEMYAELASFDANNKEETKNLKGVVLKVKVNLKSSEILNVNFEGKAHSKNETNKHIEQAKREGYKAVAFNNIFDGGNESTSLIVFDENDLEILPENSEEITTEYNKINAKYDAELKAIEAQITPEQKQQAQQLYSSYLQTTNNPTIEGFKQWNSRQQQITEPEDENGTEPEPEPKSEPEPEPEPTELFDGDGNYIGGNNASQNEDNTNTTGQPEPTPQPTIPSPKPKPKPVKTITLARISRSFSEIDTKHREQLKNELAKINAEFLKNNRDIQNAEDKNWYRAQITEAYNNFINSLLADLESASSTTYTILDKEKGLEALLKQKESSMLAQQTKQSVTTKEPTVVSPTQSFSFKTVTYKISGLAGSLVKFINNINKVIQNEFARDNYSKIMPEESNEELLRDIVLTVGFVVSKSETTTPSPYSHLIMEAIQENGVVLRVNEEMLISPKNENNIFTIRYASGHSEKLTGRQYYNKLQELKKTNYTEYLDIVPIQVITQIKRGNETIELEVASLRTTGFLKALFGQNNNLTLRIRSIRQMVLNKPLSLKVKNIKTGRFVNVGDVNTAKLLTELMTPNTPMNIGFIDANGTVSYYDHRTNSTSTSIKLTNIQIKSFPGVNIDEIPVGTPAFVIPNMDSKGKAVVIPLLTVNKEFSNETSQAVSFWLNNLATKFESLAQSKKSMSVSSIIDELKSLFYFVDYREINQNKAWNYDTDPRIRFTANLNDSKNAVFIFKVLDQSVELQVNDKNFLSNLSNLIRSINTLNFMPNINWDLFKKSSEYRDVVVRLFASSVLGHIEATSGERIFYGDNGIVLDFDSRSGMKDYFALVNSGGTIKKPESTPTTKVPVVDHRTSKESTEGTKKPKSKEKTKSKKPEGTNTTKIDPSKLSVQSNQGNPTTKPSDEGDPFGFSGLFDEDAALNNFKKKGKGGKTIGDGC